MEEDIATNSYLLGANLDLIAGPHSRDYDVLKSAFSDACFRVSQSLGMNAIEGFAILVVISGSDISRTGYSLFTPGRDRLRHFHVCLDGSLPALTRITLVPNSVYSSNRGHCILVTLPSSPDISVNTMGWINEFARVTQMPYMMNASLIREDRVFAKAVAPILTNKDVSDVEFQRVSGLPGRAAKKSKKTKKKKSSRRSRKSSRASKRSKGSKRSKKSKSSRKSSRKSKRSRKSSRGSKSSKKSKKSKKSKEDSDSSDNTLDTNLRFKHAEDVLAYAGENPFNPDEAHMSPKEKKGRKTGKNGKGKKKKKKKKN